MQGIVMGWVLVGGLGDFLLLAYRVGKGKQPIRSKVG